jgi:hypothetical protein
VPDFVGGDPESNANECPAVWVDPDTGDFLFRGKTITDPAVLDELNGDIGKSDDESDVWLPARMAALIRQALDGYEQGRQGPAAHLRRTARPNRQLGNPLRDARCLRREREGLR